MSIEVFLIPIQNFSKMQTFYVSITYPTIPSKRETYIALLKTENSICFVLCVFCLAMPTLSSIISKESPLSDVNHFEYTKMDCTGIFMQLLSFEDTDDDDDFTIVHDLKYSDDTKMSSCDQYATTTLKLDMKVENSEKGVTTQFESVAIIIPNSLTFLNPGKDQFRVAATFANENFGETLHCFRPLNSLLLVSDFKLSSDGFPDFHNKSNAQILINNLPSFGMKLDVYVWFRILPQKLIVHDLLTFEITEQSAPREVIPRRMVPFKTTKLSMSTIQPPETVPGGPLLNGNDLNRNNRNCLSVQPNSTINKVTSIIKSTTSKPKLLRLYICNSSITNTIDDQCENYSMPTKVDCNCTQTRQIENRIKRDLNNPHFLRMYMRNNNHLAKSLTGTGRNNTATARRGNRKSNKIKGTQHQHPYDKKRMFEVASENDIENEFLSLPYKTKRRGHKVITRKNSANNIRKYFRKYKHFIPKQSRSLNMINASDATDIVLLNLRRGHVRRAKNITPISRGIQRKEFYPTENVTQLPRLAKIKRGHVHKTKRDHINGTNATRTARLRAVEMKILGTELGKFRRDRRLNYNSNISQSIRHFRENLVNSLQAMEVQHIRNATVLSQLKRGHILRKKNNGSIELAGIVDSRKARNRALKQNLNEDFARTNSIIDTKRGHAKRVVGKGKPWERSLLSKAEQVKLERLITLLGLKRGHVSKKSNKTNGMGRRVQNVPSTDVDTHVDFKLSQKLIPMRRGHKLRQSYSNNNNNLNASTSVLTRKNKIKLRNLIGLNVSASWVNTSVVLKKRGHIRRVAGKDSVFTRSKDNSLTNATLDLRHQPGKVKLVKLKLNHRHLSKQKMKQLELWNNGSLNLDKMRYANIKIQNASAVHNQSTRQNNFATNAKRGHRRMSSELARSILMNSNNKEVKEVAADGRSKSGLLRSRQKGNTFDTDDNDDEKAPTKKGYPKHVVERFGKDFLLTADAVFTGCGKQYSCFHYPKGCNQQRSCQVGMAYQLSGDQIHIKLVASTQSYVAVGFSADQFMGNDAVIVCKRAAGADRVGVWEAYNKKEGSLFASSETVIQKNHTNVNVMTSSIYKGILTCDFTLPLKYETESQIMIDFKAKVYYPLLCVGINNKEPNGIGSISYHGFAITSSRAHDLSSTTSVINEPAEYYLIKIHIGLAILTYCFFMPFAILMARYGQQAYPYKSFRGYPKWIVIHVIFHSLSVVLNILILVLTYIEGPRSFFNSPSRIYHFIVCPIAVVGSILNGFLGFQIHRKKVGKEIVNWNLKKMHYSIGHLVHLFGAIELTRGAYIRKSFVDCSFAVLAGYLFLFYAFAHLLLLFNTDYLRRLQNNTEPVIRCFFGPAIHLDVHADREQYDVRRGTLTFMGFIFALFSTFLFVVMIYSNGSCNPSDPGYVHMLKMY